MKILSKNHFGAREDHSVTESQTTTFGNWQLINLITN